MKYNEKKTQSKFGSPPTIISGPPQGGKVTLSPQSEREALRWRGGGGGRNSKQISFEYSISALTSFGKQGPPNPYLPSGPGTFICESPILLSLDRAFIKSNHLLWEFKLSKINFISLKNITFNARKEFIVYLINEAVMPSVIICSLQTHFVWFL